MKNLVSLNLALVHLCLKSQRQNIVRFAHSIWTNLPNKALQPTPKTGAAELGALGGDMNKKLVTFIGLFLALYGGSYIFLSSRGSYHEYIGAASDGRNEWYPLLCANLTPSPGTGRVKSGVSGIGLFYLPLLALDQAFFHRAFTGAQQGAAGDAATQRPRA
jgi:hypothetical protein